jgi:hypothetical protein
MGNKEFTKKLTPEGDNRLRIEIETAKSKVKDIVVQLETKRKDKLYPIVRYDCSHGFFHRDLLNPKGEKTRTYLKIGFCVFTVIPAIPNAFGRSGILVKTKKDSGQDGMTY